MRFQIPNSAGVSDLVIIIVKINPRTTLTTDIKTAINPE